MKNPIKSVLKYLIRESGVEYNFCRDVEVRNCNKRNYFSNCFLGLSE